MRDLDGAVARGLRFDVELALDAIDFFRCLRHSKGEWAKQPVVLSPSECFVIGSLFGWVQSDGRRRFRKAYVEVAKKYGKSTLAAGLGLLLGFFDGEGGAEIYAAATKKKQAHIVFDEARNMVLTSPGLRQRIQVRLANLHSLDSASKFEPLGSDSDRLDGLNIHGLIVDEVHAHKSRALIDTLETAMGSRRQPLELEITTAGQSGQSVAWGERDYAVKTLEGVLSDEATDVVFAYIATLDVCESCRDKGRTAPDDTCARCDHWDDERVWVKANPNMDGELGTPKLADFRKDALAAKEKPAALNAFKRFRLNIWTESIVRWLPADAWRDNGAALRALSGRRGVLGVDLSSTRDLTAVVGVFPDPDGTYDVLAQFWIPEQNVIERVKRDRAPYDLWVRDEFLLTTPGNSIDHDVIFEWIAALPSRLNVEIPEVCVDPWHARGLTNRLQGTAGLTCVEIRQGFATLNEPSKLLETLVDKRRLRHGNHPVLGYCAANVITEIDAAGNIKPSKAKSTGRIDGISALVTALARVIAAGPKSSSSPYEEREVRLA